MQHLSSSLAATLLSAVSLSATAGDPPTPPQEKPAPSTWSKPAAAEKLDSLRGGADTVTTQAALSATVADNTARNVVTGNNVIDQGSFANMSGMPMVIQNTGANVLIQNATVINLQMR